MMNNSSNKPAATLDIQDHALPSSAAEAVTQALAPADLSPTESEQDALNGGCYGACGGIKFNHNPTLAGSADATDDDEVEAQPEAPLDLSPTESEQDALKGACNGWSCGGIKFNHNQTLAEPVDAGQGG